jgi:hypothetical protein
MDITITITDDQFAAIVSGLPDNGKPIDTVTAHLQECVQPAIMQFVKLADEKRFASVGLPNLKSIGLDEDQCALVIADATPKAAAKKAAKEAEAAARRAAREAEEIAGAIAVEEAKKAEGL